MEGFLGDCAQVLCENALEDAADVGSPGGRVGGFM